MYQTCRFDERPRTVNPGGTKKGHRIVWLNLNAREIPQPEENTTERWQGETQRLVLDDYSIEGLLEAADPAHLMLATDGEAKEILSFFGAGDDLEAWKSLRSLQVDGYDHSASVNTFRLGDHTLWLDKATRVGLVNSVGMEKEAGRDRTVFWAGGESVELGVEEALEMLMRLELYALECFNATARHLRAIADSGSVEELEAYAFRSGYPEPLSFPLSE